MTHSSSSLDQENSGRSESVGHDIRPVVTPCARNLTTALESFEDVYCPRIVCRVNDCDVRIAHTRGDYVWHVHEDTDEFFLVLAGQFEVSLQDGNGRQTVISMRQNDTFVVPRGIEHKPSSPGGSILIFELSSTLPKGRSAQAYR